MNIKEVKEYVSSELLRLEERQKEDIGPHEKHFNRGQIATLNRLDRKLKETTESVQGHKSL